MWAVLAGWAWAQSPIDVQQAATLGLPLTHDALTACDCLRLTWDNGVTLDIPRTSIARFEQVVKANGPHEMAVVMVDGSRLTLEDAPCPFVAAGIDRHQLTLRSERAVIDESGATVEAACDVFGEVLAWDEARRQRGQGGVRVISADDMFFSVLTVDKVKGEPSSADAIRRALAVGRASAAKCWALADGVSAGLSVGWTVTAKAGVRPVVKSRPSGHDAVDACFADLAANMQMPEGEPAKLKVTFRPADVR
jgi:hypothetical protein